MHSGPVPGQFQDEGELVDWPCRQCKHPQTSVRTWDSIGGGYTDYRYTCPQCGHYWWVESDDA